VGTGLCYVEQVAGRVTTGRAALTGAGQGALIGLLFALLFGLFFTGPAFLGLLLYAVIAGAIFGPVFGALAHSAMGGSRDFASVARTEAERYEVQVDEEVPMRPKSSSTPCLPRSPERPAHRPCSANGGSAVEHRMPGPDLDLPRCGHADRLCQRLGDALGR
jgi:hypothetical protein